MSPDGSVYRYISELVPESWMKYFLRDSAHPIFELELLPVLCAMHTWRDFIGHCQCVFYLDNEAAKGALVRATTCTVPGREMLQAFIEEEMACQVKVWFARVPTSSNISDSPSGLDTEEIARVVSYVVLFLPNPTVFRRRDPAMRLPNCKGVKKDAAQ